MLRIGIVILAAGESSRMGTPKQLLAFRGKPLVRHAAETALATQPAAVAVVVGARAHEVRAALVDQPVAIVENSRWPEGMGTSIHAGLAAIERDIDAVILTLADQPLVSPAVLRRLVNTQQASGQPIVTSHYAGTVGVPVLFVREFFPRLHQLRPAQGCKSLILTHEEQATFVECPEAEADIDTPADYERLVAAAIEQ